MVEPDAEIEALAAARNFAVHRGFSQTLVELVAERKVHVGQHRRGGGAGAPWSWLSGPGPEAGGTADP